MRAGASGAGGAEDAVGRAVQRRRHAGGVRDHGGGAVEVGGQRARADAELEAVPVAVHGDSVARGGDLGGQRSVALDLLAHEEERRPRAGGAELLEDRRRALGVGPVVEGERRAERAVGQPARQSERRGDGRRDRREGGR